MMTLCETFRRQAFWTWEQLGRARQLHAHLGEESLTDFNLLEIRSRHSREVVTRTFSKRDESVIGADWEWWLTGRSRRWVGFRLQAKVIDQHTDRFDHLHYTTPAGRHQVDLLCDRATKARPRCIPLYCLYTHWSSPRPRIPWRCGSYEGTPESYGCSLVDAFYVRSVRSDPDTRRLDSLLPHMMPWHCLVCCEGYGGHDLPSRALALWRAAIRRPDVEFDIEPVEEPPRYVQLLLQNELVEPPDLFLRTITVFREGQES